MTATGYAMAISLAIIFISFGIISFNEMNMYMYESTGKPLATYNTTAFIGYEDLEGVQPSQSDFNGTMNEITAFQKPENVDYDFSFWKSIGISRILVNIMITPIYGFPYFLHTAFYFPQWFVIPSIIIMNICNILFILYVFLGKEF